jgi:hypothetical protein
MSSYAAQKLAEKEKQLTKLEQQLVDIPRQIEFLSAEIATLADVVSHGQIEKKPARKAKVSKIKPARRKASVSRQKPNSDGGHWAGLLAKYAKAGSFTLDDVERDLKALGQPNMRKSIRAKLTKLTKDGPLERLADGVFVIHDGQPRGISGAELRARGIIPPHARLIGEKE